MSTYLGYDVLELNYNRRGEVEEQLRQKMDLLDAGTGAKQAVVLAPAPDPSRPFLWTARGRAQIHAMQEFLEARRGRAVPFWLPSVQWDLSLYEDLPESDTIATLRWVRFTEQMFGTTGARRHLALFELGTMTRDYYEILDAEDPRDGETESITLSPAAARDYPAASTVISFLKFCRLEEDLVEIRYLSGDVAESEIRIRELPLEAPVS